MIVDIDAGNSRIKWRVTGPGCTPSGGIVDSLDGLLNALCALPSAGSGVFSGPDRVRVASVRSEEWVRELEGRIHEACSVRIEVARSARQASGVTSAYRQPEALGVDRWLAMLAARARCSGLCVVIDCGTALTLDVIEADGRHRGGYIVPGLALQWRALEGATRIRLSGEAFRSDVAPALGFSTDEAVRHGSVAMVSGWLAHDANVQRAGSEQGLFMAGGDAELLVPLLQQSGLTVRREPDLVLDGLALALP